MGKIGLLVVNDGARYLDHEDQLLSQIVPGFAQLDPIRFVKFPLIPLGQSFQQVLRTTGFGSNIQKGVSQRH